MFFVYLAGKVRVIDEFVNKYLAESPSPDMKGMTVEQAIEQVPFMLELNTQVKTGQLDLESAYANKFK